MVQPVWSALDAVLAPHLGEGALLCVSGGPDSRTLLEACAQWPSRFSGPLAVACVDHGTRADSRAESDSVCARAHALGFDAVRLTVRARGTDEAALREARYASLVRAARERGLRGLVVAHHRGDVAEGRLLSLLGEGGGALAPVSSLAGLRVIRPLLALSREALALARFGLDVKGAFVDPERRSARARLREAGLPRGRIVEERAASDAAQRREDEATLAPMAAALLDDSSRTGVLVRAGPRALVRRAIKRALKRLVPEADVRSSGPALERVLALLEAREGGEIHLAGGVVAVIVLDGVLDGVLAGGAEGVRLMPRALAGRAVPAYAAWDVVEDAVEGTEDS